MTRFHTFSVATSITLAIYTYNIGLTYYTLAFLILAIYHAYRLRR